MLGAGETYVDEFGEGGARETEEEEEKKKNGKEQGVTLGEGHGDRMVVLFFFFFSG